MMINAYDKTYLSDCMDSLGAAFDFAVSHCGIGIAEFSDRFVSSGVASQIERGNPTYLAGLSGIELAARIIERTGGMIQNTKRQFIHSPGPEYWTGWIMAYLQWYTGWPFSFLFSYGYDAESIFLKYHPCHEASEQKFADDAVGSIRENLLRENVRLQQLRKASGLTQKELSDRSGVKLRMIQAYEQRCQDIGRAEASSVESLAHALGCSSQDLLCPEAIIRQ